MTFENNRFPVLETDRLILRQLSLEDAKDIFEFFSDEEIMRYYGMYPLVKVEQAESIIMSLNKAFEEKAGFRWGITLKGSKQVIGTLGYHNWSKRHSRIEVGYELSKSNWGNGYMKEALNAVLTYAFEYLDVVRVEGLVYPENTGSQNSLERMGFKKEGLLRKYAYFRERYQDLLMYSLLKEEF